MSTPYMAQITAYAFSVIPKGWMACNGQLLSINSNQALFALIGTTYGGDGRTTFGLPNLQGRMPMSFGNGGGGSYTLGEISGEVNHTLLQAEMPAHPHQVAASNATGSNSGALATPIQNNYPAMPAAPANTNLYASAPTAGLNLGGGSSPAGGSQPHPNQQPYLALNFCIATQGLFPSRN